MMPIPRGAVDVMCDVPMKVGLPAIKGGPKDAVEVLVGILRIDPATVRSCDVG